MIPLAPYILIAQTQTALLYSVAATVIALAIFGAGKGYFTGAPKFRSAVRTTVIGGLAAAAAYGIAKLIRP